MIVDGKVTGHGMDGGVVLGATAAGGSSRFASFFCSYGHGTAYPDGPQPIRTGSFLAPDGGVADWPSLEFALSSLPLEAPPAFVALMSAPSFVLTGLSASASGGFAVRILLWAANGDGTQVMEVAGVLQEVPAGATDFTYDWTGATHTNHEGTGLSWNGVAITLPGGGGTFGTPGSMFSTYAEIRTAAGT